MISKLIVRIVGFLLMCCAWSTPILAEPQFAYADRDIGLEERMSHLGVVYGVTWGLYPIFQPEVMRGEKGSWQEYRKNFGKTVFDQDEPFWNWVIHPISGSQLYLFYRALGYQRSDSFAMTFLSSLLFEYTVEIYSEPASFQDLYQTPVLGTALGYGLEMLSTELLNHPSSTAQFFGRLMNPLSYIVDREQVSLTPVTDFKSSFGVQLVVEW